MKAAANPNPRGRASLCEASFPESEWMHKDARSASLPGRAGGPHPAALWLTDAQQAVDRSTPYLMEFASADAGKTAFWAMRWVNTHGEHGPWSATVSGTIGG